MPAKKITVETNGKSLKEDIEVLVKHATENLGASAAAAIAPSDLRIEERVRMKCSVPKCFSWGTCAHCPPHGIPADEMRAVVVQYSSAILFRVDVPADVIAGEGISEGISQGKPDKKGNLLKLGIQYYKIYEIAAKLEGKAFHSGHHLAMGFAAGSCKSVLCTFEACTALKPGGKCRHPYKARPSMESTGMDVFHIAAKVGWDIYPIAAETKQDDIPSGSLVGLVLIE